MGTAVTVGTTRAKRLTIGCTKGKTMNRDALIRVLLSIDPNGCYTDSDCEANGYKPLTAEEALEFIKELEGAE